MKNTERGKREIERERDEGKRKIIRNTNLQQVAAVSFPSTVSKLLDCVCGRTSILRDSSQTKLRVDNKLFIM